MELGQGSGSREELFSAFEIVNFRFARYLPGAGGSKVLQGLRHGRIIE
jgi:hypothetical protein